MTLKMWEPRRAMASALLSGALLLGGLLPGTASAGYVSCQTDPVIVLSNGASIAVTLTVGATPSSVKVITYTVYAPRGTSVAAVQSLDGGLGHVELVRLVANQDAGAYAVDSYVVTSTHDTPVTVSAQMSSPDGGPVSLTGTERQHLTVQLGTT